MLRRECLNIFRSIYNFKQAYYEHRTKLWPTAASECRQAAALRMMCMADLKREWRTDVICSDASLTGTGIYIASFSKYEIQKVDS